MYSLTTGTFQNLPKLSDFKPPTLSLLVLWDSSAGLLSVSLIHLREWTSWGMFFPCQWLRHKRMSEKTQCFLKPSL